MSTLLCTVLHTILQTDWKSLLFPNAPSSPKTERRNNDVSRELPAVESRIQKKIAVDYEKLLLAIGKFPLSCATLSKTWCHEQVVSLSLELLPSVASEEHINLTWWFAFWKDGRTPIELVALTWRMICMYGKKNVLILLASERRVPLPTLRHSSKYFRHYTVGMRIPGILSAYYLQGLVSQNKLVLQTNKDCTILLEDKHGSRTCHR